MTSEFKENYTYAEVLLMLLREEIKDLSAKIDKLEDKIDRLNNK